MLLFLGSIPAAQNYINLSEIGTKVKRESNLRSATEMANHLFSKVALTEIDIDDIEDLDEAGCLYGQPINFEDAHDNVFFGNTFNTKGIKMRVIF